MMKILVAAMSGLLLLSCATSHQPRYKYNQIMVENHSRTLIRNVTITVSGTGRSFSCGNIAPLGICSNRFPRRDYQGNPIQVDWTFGNSTRQSGEFVVEVPAAFQTSQPLRGVLAINPEGSIAAYFEQDSPGR